MKAARDARSAAVVINAGSRRGAAHELAVDTIRKAGVPISAGRLAGTNVVLSVLPLGTANDFARTLEIPNNLAEACAAVADGKVVDVDLGRANGEPFLNVASAGLSVAVTEL